MQTEDPKLILGDPKRAQRWVASIGAIDETKSIANINSIIHAGLSDKAMADVFQQLNRHLPTVSDPDLALNNFERFILSVPDAEEIGTKLVENQELLPALLTFFSSSQYLSDVLARDYRCFQELCDTVGNLYSLNSLKETIHEQMDVAKTKASAMEVLRRFKHQQMLRVAWYDLIDGGRIEQITQQISWVAMAICDAAYRWARRELEKKFGVPMNAQKQPCQYVIVAMGKLGGGELNYSSDIDLMMIYDQDGKTDSRSPRSNREFFGQLTRDIVKLVNEITPLGAAYRVDLRLRPEGARGAICHSLASVLKYYDFQGRTWERQALIKARAIAGDLELGQRLLKQLQNWIFRISLARTDISGIRALKRKIERRAASQGEERTNIKTGRGGIRDVEFVIQFMQLLNGHGKVNVRTSNTLTAIGRLERAGCLTMSESTRLIQNYSWLRKLEHRLQLMFNLQTHTLPEDPLELQKIAVRMGYEPYFQNAALEQFSNHLLAKTEINRRILNHLLHGAFGPEKLLGNAPDSGADDTDQEVPIEVDLVLDPDPSEEMITAALAPYGFDNPKNAYQRLMELAKEKTKFLSPRRCNHFFAAIAKSLLSAVARTPDPDATLVSLSSISDSLGAKGVLWELFSFNPPTLSLYVRLCASSDYLASIFKSNPGMIDELMDALQLQQLPDNQWLSEHLKELARGAEDLHLIVLSFKNAYHLRVGIRDILGRDEIRDTHRTLSDIAEVCLQTITRRQYDLLIQKLAANPEQAPPAEESPFVILGLGKLGGREPNYHSDLDVIFLYRQDEYFESVLGDVTSQFFFSELAASITRAITQSTAVGKLYEMDGRLRPTGKSGSLAVSEEEMLRYFHSGKGQLWERQSLCKSRVVFGGTQQSEHALAIVHKAIRAQPWDDSMAGDIYRMRLAMQKGATEYNLKRGVGGTVDIEFIIQMLQLKHCRDDPSVLVPGTLDATEKLIATGILDAERGRILMDAYQLLRSVEARLRLMNVTARHDLPADQKQLTKLAFLLNYSDAYELVDAITHCRETVRQQFEQLMRPVDQIVT